ISHVKSAFLFAIPLIPHVVTNSMLAQVDRLLINKFLGPSDTGVYSFAYNISICIVVFIMAWNSSWQPKLYKLIETGSQVEAKKVILKSTCYLLLVTVGLMVFSYEISNIISANDYANSSKVLLLLIMGNSLIHVYLSYANYIFYSKKTIFISISTTVSLVLNIALNYFWIPFFGIEGAAWATVLSYATLCVLNYIFSVKYLKLSNLSLLVFIGFFCSILVHI
ncbi:polysaccharide biosynthesis C-terminal domain-containing protein, partial [Vibrio parahaemolyticus]|nr:polysaccharide biosynthesis C-terminal domain-containing protein [Vibrio parahaemolyticus]